VTAGCDRCISYNRGFVLQKPEVFRTERTYDMNGTLRQCRACATWWIEWSGNFPHIISDAEAQQLIRDNRPSRDPSSFGEVED
jgi:hypothetical protein